MKNGEFKFFALFSRMKHIFRWSLMRNTQMENLSEHSGDVAAIAHAIAVIENNAFGGNVNADRCAVLGLFHDMPEIFTGDLPTPIKYHSRLIKEEYDEIEKGAIKKLLAELPDYMQKDYTPIFIKSEEDARLWKIVKAADKISAYKKCVEELRSGNADFADAADSTLKAIESFYPDMPEVKLFMDEFASGFAASLDQINKH